MSYIWCDQPSSRSYPGDSLSAASSLKHAANMQKTYTNRQQAQERASQLLREGYSVEECVRGTPSGRFTLCVNGRLIKPSDFSQVQNHLCKLSRPNMGTLR